VYAHLPMVLGPGGGKLSKRHGADSVEEYRDQGFLAEALVNYLALLGWSPADDREILTREEIVAEFDLERVNPSAATFDPKKLEWMNGEHIRRLDVEDLAGEALPFAKVRASTSFDIRTFDAAVKLAQERSTTLVQIAEQAAFLFVPDDEFEIDAEVVAEVTKLDHVDELMAAAIEHIEHCEWNHEGIALQPVLKALGLKSKHMKVLYAAVTGRTAGLPLFESIEMLGRERTLVRLRRARERFARG
jgi:glutamyl-tRNA synthetase